MAKGLEMVWEAPPRRFPRDVLSVQMVSTFFKLAFQVVGYSVLPALA